MDNRFLLKEDLDALRRQSPIVHNITNFVVMNNTANALLALGASPVMAHSPDEVLDMVGIASSLVLNIGTLSAPWVDAMELAGQAANKKGIPIVFDPVGAGATPYRNAACERLIQSCRPTFIRGNASEIMALVDTRTKTKGVDSSASSQSAIEAAKQLAIECPTVVIVSGQTDYITDGKELLEVDLGHPLMPKVTGMGCTATALIGAYAAVSLNALQAANHAMQTMGIAGAMAGKKAQGPGTFQLHFLDALYQLSGEHIRSYLGETL